MILHSDMVPTMGLVEENAELRTRALMHEVGMYRCQEDEIALGLMMVDESIDDLDVGEATWRELTPMQKRRYDAKAAKLAATMKLIRFAPAV